MLCKYSDSRTRWVSMRLSWSLVCEMIVRVNFRKSMTSLTVAVQLFLMLSTISTNSGKFTVRCAFPLISSDTNSASAWSTKAATSRPASVSTWIAVGFCRTSRNSSLLILSSSRAPNSLKRDSMRCFTKVAVTSSFSATATWLTASQMTPINMFMTVKELMSTNAQKMTKHTMLCSAILLTTEPRLSMKMPSNSSVYMVEPMELK
mmetsp:Transcript_93980/g.210600  ORF Transcript_93980/g.210600 Transcript_93980/m.210600 type:complete len:205 (+) Transcript_93980:57-671(+)